MSSSEFLNYALGMAAIVGSAALVYMAFRVGEVCQASKTVLRDVEAVTRTAREAETSIVSFIRRVKDFFA